VGVRLRVCPLFLCRSDEAFSLAIGLWLIRPGTVLALVCKGWRKKTMVALAMLVLGGFVCQSGALNDGPAGVHDLMV